MDRKYEIIKGNKKIILCKLKISKKIIYQIIYKGKIF
jgi:hypothetical protein